ncbi:hypothetical protein ACFWAY_20535 [Rhodococcus sp. NPDC059968]|uniref:hypothetical protein n=1 Tax=Rhodococcus sp. NPDC059968 TaxID=3347017 RepID=UPI003670AEAB
MTGQPVTYVIDGARIHTLDSATRRTGRGVRAELERALREDGPTAFDWVVDIFEFRDVRLDLR